MTRLTDSHLKKLNDEDRRTIALRILNDAISALDTSIEEYGLTGHPDLDLAPVHRAANWLRKVLNNPDAGCNYNTMCRHSAAVRAFRNAAWGIGESTIGNGRKFPSYRNAVVNELLLNSVYYDGGTPHRPSAYWLHVALVGSGDGFIPGHETTGGYALKVLCDSDDPRLPALAESYIQSGLQVNLRPAINRATRQLARLDELTELNR